MGNENDKRINKSKSGKNKNNNNNNNSNNNSNNTNNNPAANSQKLPTQNINLNQNQNERINPYDQSKKQNNTQINQPPGNMGRPGGGLPPIAALSRSRTQIQNRNVITTKMLKDAFRTYCIDGDYLNRARFNDAIESIFRFDIPEMHYTHLCNKIYDLLDSSGDGKIQEDEFLEGLGNVLKNRSFRVLLTMMAMMSLPDKTRDYIEINEIKDFFYHSYVEGFKHLGWQIKRNPEEFKRNNLPVATIEQLGKWAQKFEKKIRDEIDNDFKQFDSNIGNSITFDQFENWLTRADRTIYIKYGNKNIKIATSLLPLDTIHYNESEKDLGSGAYPNI